MNKFKQLALNLCLKDTTTFANFFVGTNTQLVDALIHLPQNNSIHFIYIWGKPGSGKSHLLSAACQNFSENTLGTTYLPLEEIKNTNPGIFTGLEDLDLVCIDDLHLLTASSLCDTTYRVFGDNLAWEEQLFHCFNKIIENGKKLIITANTAPQNLHLNLADLKSRMASGLTFELHELTDAEKVASLKLRAKLRGLDLNDQAAQFLLHHYARDTKNLFIMLDKLDKAALTAQRKLTIPFIKSVLEA